MVWEGEVDGAVILYVRGRRVDLQVKSGLPVQRQNYRFAIPLPDSRQDVQLQVNQGRGHVRIAEQPRLDNNYTLAVRIDDHQAGSSRYALSFYWSAEGYSGSLPPTRIPPPPGRGAERVIWSGRVDGEVLVECGSETCASQVVSGMPVLRESFRFSRPMPEREAVVTLGETEGRGEIRLLEQPGAANGYRARVRIRDPQGGAGDYAFSLLWERPPRTGSERLFSQRGLVWSGRVDGRVRITVERRQAVSEVLSGAPVEGEQAAFERELPARQGLNPTLKRLRGRGRVEIVEFPSPRNGYRLVFEIDDRQGGSDQYQVEVGW